MNLQCMKGHVVFQEQSVGFVPVSAAGILNSVVAAADMAAGRLDSVAAVAAVADMAVGSLAGSPAGSFDDDSVEGVEPTALEHVAVQGYRAVASEEPQAVFVYLDLQIPHHCMTYLH